MPAYNASVRKEKIGEILKGKPVKTGEKLFGAGKKDVYAIPVDYLTYNPSNSRFRAEAKTFEAETSRKLDITRQDDHDLIENFIWELSKSENESTIHSLLRDGQQQHGIVTRDGVVLSGNRRLRMLNEIQRHPEKYYNKNPERFAELGKFEAIVLDEENISPERMVQLEVHYQFGEEAKVGYNPIQKYLSAYDQKHENGFDETQIASNFNVTKPEIVKWLEVYELMSEYLEYTGQHDRFTALYELEDPFLQLRAKLKKLRSYKSASVRWAYEDMDIEVLKFTFFDYLYARDAMKGEKKYRAVLDFFDDETTWNNFINSLERDGQPISEYQTLDEYEKQHPEKAPEKVAEIRRSQFAEDNKSAYEKAFIDANVRTINISRDAKPLEKIEKTREAIIDTLEFLHDLKRKSYSFDDKSDLLKEVGLVAAEASNLREFVNKL